MLTKQQIQQIKEFDLRTIVEHYRPGTKVFNAGPNYTCSCPFHDERDPSFAIEKMARKSKSNLPIWCCMACGISGVGALSLIAQFENINRNDKSRYKELLAIGARFAGIPFNENEDYQKQQLYGETEYISPVEKTTIVKMKGFTNYALEVIGCKVTPQYEPYINEEGREMLRYKTDDKGNRINKYSFGDDFRPEHLSRDFRLWQLQSVTYPPAEGRNKSRRLTATDDYPIFALIYEHDGKEWGKIYQPLAPENFRFTYFGDHPELKSFLFGDTMALLAMEMKSEGGVERFRNHVNKMGPDGSKRRYYETSDDENANTDKLSKLILCSGMSDAINTYYKGGVNVLFPNSEGSEITWWQYKKIEDCSADRYVLYDLDKTGMRNANKIALKYPTCKVIILPEDLKEIISTKGKPSKDAKDYFTLYESRILAKRDENIKFHFQNLLNSSKALMFWNKFIEYDKDDKTKIKKVRFDINSSSFLPFLAANGVYRYKDPDTKKLMYIHERHNIVDVIDEKEMQAYANTLMVNYIKNSRHYDVALENLIHTSAKVKRDSLNLIPETSLNLDSWGPDFDYLFFRNGALRITGDEIKRSEYKSLPYQVFRDTIMPDDFHLAEETFLINPNPELPLLENEIAEMQKREIIDRDILAEKQQRLRMLKEIGRFRIEWLKPINEQPVIVQFIYDTCRMYWRKEESGVELTEAEQLEHDAHFISKFNAFGFALCRYRTKTRPWMILAMENKVKQEGKSEGGSGKSLLLNLLGKVRPMNPIPGKSYDHSKGAQNFHGVEPKRTAFNHFEDLTEKTKIEQFYNLADADLPIKRLYENVTIIPFKYVPVNLFTTNFAVDMSLGSTMRRLYTIATSDYYHSADISGNVSERNPSQKFGGEIMGEFATQKEKNEFFSFMARSMSFFMRYKEKINPPMAGVRYRSLIREIGQEMHDFFSDFFHNPAQLNCYHSYGNMLLMYKNFQTLSEEYKDKLSPKKLREKLAKYCEYNGLVFNPPGCFTNDGDRAAQRIRVTVWETVEKQENGLVLYERHRQSALCWYIGELGKEPLSPQDIPEAPITDPFPEQADVEAPAKQRFLNENKPKAMKPVSNEYIPESNEEFPF